MASTNLYGTFASLRPDFDLCKADSPGLQIVGSLVRGGLRGEFTLTTEDTHIIAAIVFSK